MKTKLAAVCLSALVAAAPGLVAAKGCVKGAAVGGVAGHVAGHHGVLGAAVGCAVGHHRAAVKDKQAAAATARSDSTGNAPAAPAAGTPRRQ